MDLCTGIFVDATNTGTNPVLADTDGDGVNDGDEIAAGTNPNGPAGVPALGPGQLALLALILLALGTAAILRPGSKSI
ncbi:MAG: thrombospondin type 3 repeat-containing protein [bacterium]